MKKPAKVYAIMGSIIALLCIALLVMACALNNREDSAGQVSNESDVILQEELAKKESEIQKLEAQIVELTDQAAAQEDAVSKTQAEIDKLEKQIASAGSEKASLAQKKKELEAQKTELENSGAVLRTEIATLKNTLEVERNTFLVVFVDDGGVAYRENVAKNGDVSYTPTPADRVGHDAKWSGYGENITEDIVITASYAPKRYNITYILGRPLDSYYNLCGAHQYNENNEVELLGVPYVLDFSTNIVTNTDDTTLTYAIVDDKFTINNITYTIARDYKVVYAVIGENVAIAKPAFWNLPTTFSYGETLVFDFYAENYVNYVKRDGTAGVSADFGRRFPYSWVIYGADAVTYDTQYVDANTKIHVQATGDLLIFVEYQREPS